MTLKEVKQYDSALNAFKRMLQIAWFINDDREEIRAYEQLSQAYFYKGELAKAAQCNTRALKGLLEEPDSDERISSNNKFARKLRLEKEQSKCAVQAWEPGADIQRVYKQVLPFNKLRPALNENLIQLDKFKRRLKDKMYELDKADNLSTVTYETKMAYISAHNKTLSQKEKAKVHYLARAIDFKLDKVTYIHRKSTPFELL